MADFTTVRVGDLPPSGFNLTDNLPHEVGTELNRGTVQQLADVIGSYLGTSDSLAFNPSTVSDGETLPETSSNEWMLVGKGTFHNVGGGFDILTTEELNAVTSNGSYWILAVEIPVNVELAGITQNIRSGYTETAPSEDAVYLALAQYVKTVDLPTTQQIYTIDYPPLEEDGVQTYLIPVGATAIKAFINGGARFPLTDNNADFELDTFTQEGTGVTFSQPTFTGNLITIDYKL